MVRTVFAALLTLSLSACVSPGDALSGHGSGASPITTGDTPTSPPAQTTTPTPDSSSTPSTPSSTSTGELTLQDCPTSEGYSVSSYSQPDADGKDLLVLGIYESRSDHGGGSHPEGTATVHERRTTPHILVLSSYEPTLWTIDAAAGTQLESVILNGYYTQRVTGLPPNVKVIDRTGVGHSLADCAIRWPDDPEGCETPKLASGLRQLTSRDVTGFAGCYRATQFTVGERSSTPPSTHPNPNPGPAVQYKATCTPGQGVLTTYVAPTPGTPELHLMGVYETHSNHSGDSHPEGEASVYVTRTTPLVLALSSYEPVHWTVNAAAGARIQRIILNGLYNQRVTAPQDIPVEVHAGSAWLGSYAYAWPSSSGGSDTPRLVSALEQRTGLSLSSFAGCYQGTSFTLQ